MPTIQLKTMTRELCHELYKHWTNDASIYMDMHLFQPYVYDEAAVNRYFDMKGQDASRRLFAIMLGDKVIGELQLKQIDHDKKECSLSIHMQNDAVKGRGYGTQAERLAVKTAFDELGMAAVNADTIRKNTRSQHVLEKAFALLEKMKHSNTTVSSSKLQFAELIKGALLHLSVYRASIPCLSPWERWPSVARTERATNDHTKRQCSIRKCPAASQGDDTPRTEALVPFSAQISSKNLQTADYRQIHRGLLLRFGQTGH